MSPVYPSIKWNILLGIFVILCVKLNAGDDVLPPNTLYFGWFFPEPIATSLQQITSDYLKQSFDQIPEVKSFLTNLSQASKIDNPLDYFQKPVDPATGDKDLTYHVTAMFCGDKNCTSYYNRFKDELNQEFQTSLIGMFFTDTTFGLRVLLTDEQEQMFDNSIDSNEIQISERVQDFPGIEFIPQRLNFTPSHSKAHVTLGCGPGIPPQTTGPDLLKIVQWENNPTSFSRKDVNLTDVGVLSWYSDSKTKEVLGFVFYLQDKMVAKASFNVYQMKPNGDSGSNSVQIFYSFQLITIFCSLFIWIIH